VIRLGSRGSDLALTQSRQVAHDLQAATGESVEIEIFTTKGDKILDRPLPEIGGKGLFTEELEQLVVPLLVLRGMDAVFEGVDPVGEQAIGERADHHHGDPATRRGGRRFVGRIGGKIGRSDENHRAAAFTPA